MVEIERRGDDARPRLVLLSGSRRGIAILVVSLFGCEYIMFTLLFTEKYMDNM